MYGAHLKQARVRAGLSVAEAASLAGVGPDAIYRFERDANSPSLETLDAMAAAYGVLAGDLLPNSGIGSDLARFEPLMAALMGLDDDEIQDQILILAAQARLNRNAIARRASRPAVAPSIRPESRNGRDTNHETPEKTDKARLPL